MTLLAMSDLQFEHWFGMVEMLFLLVCIYFAFKTAHSLKGGVFESGMIHIAWGFVILAFGHGISQLAYIFEVDVLELILRQQQGKITELLIFVFAWGVLILGFMKIYQATRS